MRRSIAAAAGGVALAVSLTACGTSGVGGTDGGDGGSHKGVGGVALTAEQIVAKSAQKTSAVKSYKMALAMNMVVPGEGKLKMRGHGAYQLKPDRAFEMKLDMSGGQGVSQMMQGGIEERMVGGALYLKMPMLTKLSHSGKPWMKVSLDGTGPGGANLKSLMSQSKSADPRAMMKMLTTSKDVKKVGQETVNGVSTTHYSGTFDASQALGKLGAKQREAIGSQLSKLKDMHFDLWADGNQLPRKIKMSGKVSQMSYVAVETLSGFNSPVHVTAPPASQTGQMGG